jgi:hypothetical protein
VNDDVVFDLEHDHVGLTQLIAELRGLLVSIERGGASVEAMHGRIHDLALELRDELLEHFGDEEEGVFPYLAELRPELVPELEKLSVGHDALCGTAARIAGLAERGHAEFAQALPLVTSLFGRLDTAYEDHARVELAFLRRAGGLLGDGERRALAERLRGL